MVFCVILDNVSNDSRVSGDARFSFRYVNVVGNLVVLVMIFCK